MSDQRDHQTIQALAMGGIRSASFRGPCSTLKQENEDGRQRIPSLVLELEGKVASVMHVVGKRAYEVDRYPPRGG